jgi:hypothetical protein
MRTILMGVGAAALALVFAGQARADDRHGWSGHYHHGHGRGYYGHSRPGYYGYGGHVHGGHSSRWGHFDYVPGHYHRHGNHAHYVPPHYDYHYRGRRYEVVPGPFPGSWSVSPWHHRRD